jgi:tripartite-type tricarboxylate transporter receptor subunit TctC
MMSMVSCGRRAAFVLFAAAALAAAPVAAQDFSGKQIRIIVGLLAGGSTDVTARLIAQKLGPELKTTVIVENRAGGIFVPAMRDLTSSPADGRTLLMISTSNLVTQPIHPDYPFDLRAMTAVTEVASGPLILVARKDLPIKTVAQLIDYAKKNPDKLTFGSGGGTGSSMYLATEMFKLRTGIKPVHIPYKGNAGTLNDLLGGHIDMMFDAMPAMSEQVKAGSVTPLAVTSLKRSPALPDVPTFAELGVADFEVAGWFGLLAPPNTPPDVVQVLRDAVARVVKMPDVVAQFDKQGVVPVASQPAEWAAYIRSELDRWGKVVKEANIKPE